MKRSMINTLILDAIKTFETAGFKLPPFAYWKPEEWRSKGYSVRQTITEALVSLDRNDHKSDSSIDELNKSLNQVHQNQSDIHQIAWNESIR